MRIAVLALQGAFAEHRQKLAQLGVDSFEVRQLKDWDQPKDGLIIPGGESTTQAKLLNELGLMEPVKEAIAAGLPVYGTCAGLILLAKKIEGEPSQRIASMDITAFVKCRDVHRSNALARLALNLLGKKNQAGTSTINRQAGSNRLLHRLHQSQFIQEFRLGGTLTARNNQAILWLVPILQLANLETIHAQLSQLLSVLSKSAL